MQQEMHNVYWGEYYLAVKGMNEEDVPNHLNSFDEVTTGIDRQTDRRRELHNKDNGYSAWIVHVIWLMANWWDDETIRQKGGLNSSRYNRSYFLIYLWRAL